MRIVSGLLKSRQLVSPAGSHVRPTTDKLRSAIFSILGSLVENADILDAFAGSGALGIEAYSRGAGFINFIDADTSALKTNLKLLPKEVYKDFKGNFFSVGKMLGKKYDIIFVDPPYLKHKPQEILDAINNYDLLKDDGIIVYEEFHKADFSEFSGFEMVDERRYGDNVVRFLKKGGS